MTKSPFFIKQVRGNTDLEYEVKAGYSIKIVDIQIYNPTTNYVTCKSDQRTVGYFRAGGNLGSHVPLIAGKANHSHGLDFGTPASSSAVQKGELNDAFGVGSTVELIAETGTFVDVPNAVGFDQQKPPMLKTLLQLLYEKELWRGFPLDEGQTFRLSGAAQSGSIQVIKYIRAEAGVYKKTDPNGSECLDYDFINYGRPENNIVTSGNTLYDIQQTAAEFPTFPFAKDVPSNFEIDVLGLLASDIVDDRGGNDTMNSSYLKLYFDQEVLFDEDLIGLLLEGIVGVTDTDQVIAQGRSLIGNFSDVDLRMPMIFDEPISFASGETLDVLLSTIAGASQSASDLVAEDVEIGIIERVRRTS